MNRTGLLAALIACLLFGGTMPLLRGQATGPNVVQQLHSQYRISPVSSDGLSVVRIYSILTVAQSGIKASPPSSFGCWYNSHKPGDGIKYSKISEAITPADLKTQMRLLEVGEKVVVIRLDVTPSEVNFCVQTYSDNPSVAPYRSAVVFQFPQKKFVQLDNLKAIQDSIAEVFTLDTGSPTEIPVSEQVAGLNVTPQAPAPEAAVPTPTVAPLRLPSTYVSAQTSADQLQLNADNSFSLQEAGQAYQGTFVDHGNALELSIRDGPKSTATIQGNSLTDSLGQTWVLRDQPTGTDPGGALLQNAAPVSSESSVAASTPATSGSTRGPVGPENDIEAGKEIKFPVKYVATGPGTRGTSGFYTSGGGLVVGMADGVLTLSKTTFAFGPCLVNRGFRMQHCDFRVSPGKILELENQPEQSSRIHVKVAIKNAKGDKEDKKDYYFYNVGAREVGDGAVGGPGTSIICDGCDDSMDVLYGLLTRIRQPGEAASVGKASPDYDATVQKGMDAYSKSLTPNPNDTAAHNNYVLALAKAKKYPEMEAEMRKAAELDPATAYSKFYNLGALLSMNGQGEAAAKAFKMAIDAAPDNPRNVEAYYQYGLSLAGQATVDKDGKFVFPLGTLEAFQKYLDLAPTGRNARVCKDMITQLGGVK